MFNIAFALNSFTKEPLPSSSELNDMFSLFTETIFELSDDVSDEGKISISELLNVLKFIKVWKSYTSVFKKQESERRNSTIYFLHSIGNRYVILI